MKTRILTPRRIAAAVCTAVVASQVLPRLKGAAEPGPYDAAAAPGEDRIGPTGPERWLAPRRLGTVAAVAAVGYPLYRLRAASRGGPAADGGPADRG